MSAVPGRIVSTYCSSVRLRATGRATAGIGTSRWNGWNGADCEARAYALVRAPVGRARLSKSNEHTRNTPPNAARERGPAGDEVALPIHHSPSLPASVSVRRSEDRANRSVAVTRIGPR